MVGKGDDCMNEWWKSPVLQGEDNDYGQYDYLINKLPDNIMKWEWYHRKCDSCGKYHKLNLYSVHHFYTFDGWDYNFNLPITSNKTINASWEANPNTPYKVEYYFENIESKKNHIISETRDDVFFVKNFGG